MHVQPVEGTVLLPSALPKGGGPLVDSRAGTGTFPSTGLAAAAPAPAGPEDLISGSIADYGAAPAPSRTVLQQQPVSSTQHTTSSNISSRVVAVSPEQNLYGIRRPISPASLPRAASPAVVSGAPVTETGTGDSGHHHRRRHR
jgi:hypothetical protein